MVWRTKIKYYTTNGIIVPNITVNNDPLVAQILSQSNFAIQNIVVNSGVANANSTQTVEFGDAFNSDFV